MASDPEANPAYESGARKLVERPDLKNDDLVHTGDPADEPKVPYGLTEPSGDRGDRTRHHDGQRPAVSQQKSKTG